jgi:hypothetical protein
VNGIHEVTGSIPVSSTNSSNNLAGRKSARAPICPFLVHPGRNILKAAWDFLELRATRRGVRQARAGAPRPLGGAARSAGEWPTVAAAKSATRIEAVTCADSARRGRGTQRPHSSVEWFDVRWCTIEDASLQTRRPRSPTRFHFSAGGGKPRDASSSTRIQSQPRPDEGGVKPALATRELDLPSLAGLLGAQHHHWIDRRRPARGQVARQIRCCGQGRGRCRQRGHVPGGRRE